MAPDKTAPVAVDVISDNLSEASWSWGCVATVDSNGRTMFVVDAHRGDDQHFVVRAVKKLMAFLELEFVISGSLLLAAMVQWNRTSHY
jgi:L-asparaginase II